MKLLYCMHIGFYEGDEILAVNNNDIFDPENGLGIVLCAIAGNLSKSYPLSISVCNYII